MIMIRKAWGHMVKLWTANHAHPEGYARRARKLMRTSAWDAAAAACRDGLERFQGDPQLQDLARQINQREEVSRHAALWAEVEGDPTPEAFRELCELMFKRGDAAGTLALFDRWRAVDATGEPLYYEAAAFGEAFFGSYLSRDGLRAFELATEAGKRLREDTRPLRLQFEIARRCGAWEDARSALVSLLELMPGNRVVEGRLRSVTTNCATSRSLSKGLADVERVGRFLGDEASPEGRVDRDAVRPGLQELAARADVNVAFYLSGSTALVQGAQGRAADRSARAVRDILSSTRSSSRKLLLGAPKEIRCEGSAGSLVIGSGSGGAAAVWGTRTLSATSGRLVRQLSVAKTSEAPA